MRCLYEVTLHIDPSLAGEYDPWLQAHVADMLALPGFISARIYTVEPDQENPGTARPRRPLPAREPPGI